MPCVFLTTLSGRPPRKPVRSPALKVERIINEPTAAALAYGFEKKKNEKNRRLRLRRRHVSMSPFWTSAINVFEVLSTNGDTHLGGDNLDHIVMDYIADEFKKKEGIDLRNDPDGPPANERSCGKRAEVANSRRLWKTSINLPFHHRRPGPGPKHLQMTITRSKFEQLCEANVRSAENRRATVLLKMRKLKTRRNRRSRPSSAVSIPYPEGTGKSPKAIFNKETESKHQPG